MSSLEANSHIQQLLGSDRRKALTILFETHYTMMVQAANRILKQPQSAEDLVQEIFVRLYEDASVLENTQNFGGYLRRTAVNRAIDQFRKNSRTKSIDLDRVFDLSTSEEADVPLANSEAGQAYLEALEQLPPQCRVVFTLKRNEGMTNAEVADHLGISVKTVENQMTKALKRLRTLLAPLLSSILWLLWRGLF